MSFPVPYFWICLLSAEFHKCFDILGAKPKASLLLTLPVPAFVWETGM